MVDRAARDKLADDLTALIDGRMKTGKFTALGLEDASDHALVEAWRFGWALYSDDVGPSRLSGRHAVKAADREIAERCVLFLKTDLAYAWPPFFRGTTPYGGASLGCFVVFGLPSAALSVMALERGELKAAVLLAGVPIMAGSIGFRWQFTRRARQEEECRFWASGDRDVWPLLRRAEFEAARTCRQPDTEITDAGQV